MLIEAQARPYDRRELNNFTSNKAAVSALDALLGPDIDLPQAQRDRLDAMRVAQWVVASFIPFRGLVREVSGARKHQDEVTIAIQAGLARRGFLKGLGAARKCAYPASPATPAVIAAYKAKFAADDKAEKDRKEAQAAEKRKSR